MTTHAALRHCLATLAYRAGKALRDTPETFGDFRAGSATRTPREILAHMGDLLDWGLHLANGHHIWHDATPLPWPQEIERFFAALHKLDAHLATEATLGWSAERIFQGPIADAFTHVGQLSLLRGLAGVPVRGENYAKADIETGQVGLQQAAPRYEF